MSLFMYEAEARGGVKGTSGLVARSAQVKGLLLTYVLGHSASVFSKLGAAVHFI